MTAPTDVDDSTRTSLSLLPATLREHVNAHVDAVAAREGGAPWAGATLEDDVDVLLQPGVVGPAYYQVHVRASGERRGYIIFKSRNDGLLPSLSRTPPRAHDAEDGPRNFWRSRAGCRIQVPSGSVFLLPECIQKQTSRELKTGGDRPFRGSGRGPKNVRHSMKSPTVLGRTRRLHDACVGMAALWVSACATGVALSSAPEDEPTAPPPPQVLTRDGAPASASDASKTTPSVTDATVPPDSALADAATVPTDSALGDAPRTTIDVSALPASGVVERVALEMYRLLPRPYPPNPNPRTCPLSLSSEQSSYAYVLLENPGSLDKLVTVELALGTLVAAYVNGIPADAVRTACTGQFASRPTSLSQSLSNIRVPAGGTTALYVATLSSGRGGDAVLRITATN